MTLAPKVSIVVAAYNVAQYLPRCVETLLGQTEKSLEVLIVNDGSTDETLELAKRYALKDSRVRVIHRQNGGVSAARNTGLDAATGEFICFMDSDDWAELSMVKSMISWCESSGSLVAIAGAYVDFHDQDDHLIRSERRDLLQHEIHRGEALGIDVDDNFVNLLGYVWNKLYRRDWLMRSGYQFEEGLSLIEDTDFNSRVLAAADRLVFIPESFVHYVQRPRLTLGSARDETFLAHQLRAMGSMDSLLEAWGVDSAERAERKARASGLALWGALRWAADSPSPKEILRRTVEQPATKSLLISAQARSLADWRGLWASCTLMRRWFGIALLPVYGSQALKVLTGSTMFWRHSRARSNKC